jgi:hypothetical protein
MGKFYIGLGNSQNEKSRRQQPAHTKGINQDTINSQPIPRDTTRETRIETDYIEMDYRRKWITGEMRSSPSKINFQSIRRHHMNNASTVQLRYMLSLHGKGYKAASLGEVEPKIGQR